MLVVAGVLKSEDIENHVDYLRAAIGRFRRRFRLRKHRQQHECCQRET